jgi:hypothetical protein
MKTASVDSFAILSLYLSGREASAGFFLLFATPLLYLSGQEFEQQR